MVPPLSMAAKLSEEPKRLPSSGCNEASQLLSSPGVARERQEEGEGPKHLEGEKLGEAGGTWMCLFLRVPCRHAHSPGKLSSTDKAADNLVLSQPSTPDLSHRWPSQAPQGTDQVLFPAAAASDPQVGAIVSSYASSGQGTCTAGPGRGLWTETV